MVYSRFGRFAFALYNHTFITLGASLTMTIGFLLKGLILGFSIAAPVGPIGIMCIRRTLADGRRYGLASGLGAATADAIYGCIAAFGVAFIANFLVCQLFWLRLFGAAFLAYLGIKTLLTKPAVEAARSKGRSLLGAYGSTFLLTLTNPITIFTYIAVFSGLGLGTAAGDYASAAFFILGVFSGSALWWVILSFGVGLLCSRVTPSVLQWVNRFSGLVIIGFAIYMIIGLL
jgi:threonine/homoserine/homoserine lactone efflux protein